MSTHVTLCTLQAGGAADSAGGSSGAGSTCRTSQGAGHLQVPDLCEHLLSSPGRYRVCFCWGRLRDGAGRGPAGFILSKENGNTGGKRKARMAFRKEQPQELEQRGSRLAPGLSSSEQVEIEWRRRGSGY